VLRHATRKSGRERDLEAAADRVPVQRCEHELRRLLEAAERLVRVQAEVVLEARSDLAEHPDVRSGAEELVAGAGQHDDVDRVVEARGEDRVVELQHHRVRVAVRRRGVRQRQRRDAALDRHAHEIAESGGHGVSSGIKAAQDRALTERRSIGGHASEFPA
jgi:hypothetical protein